MTKELIFPKMVPLSLATLMLGTVAPVGWVNAGGAEPYDEAHVFFELNHTDGDLGIHSLIDGDAWDRLTIRDPDLNKLLKIRVKGRLEKQGLTELFFESAEPPFEIDEDHDVALKPAKFFRRFPEGKYKIEGETLEGDPLKSRTKVTHVMPAPPVAMINGMAAAEDCDVVSPVVATGEDVTISWAPVTLSHPDMGRSGEMIDVINYEVVVEVDETPFKASAVLPPSVTSYKVPAEIISLNDKLKFEVLVRESSYNQTAIESCFCIDECPVEDED